MNGAPMKPDLDPDFEKLSAKRLRKMAAAGERILECYRVLGKSAANVVGEVLRGHGAFYELDHYPPGDVFDSETHSQYYYHAHREGEHGHFHTFVRSAGIRKGVKPVKQSHETYMDEREDYICHLVAISMDAAGYPISLFTTNRWVTAENWYKAGDVIQMVDNFEMDLAWPSWPVNIWISSMIRLFAPQIAELVRERDRAVAQWRKTHPGLDVFEDHIEAGDQEEDDRRREDDTEAERYGHGNQVIGLA